MEYEVFFDISQSGCRQWPFAACGLIFVAIGAGLVFFRKRLPGRYPSLFSFGILGFAVCWTALAFASTLSDYLNLASAFREGRCEVVEGVVSDFHRMPEGGHDSEWFVVGGKRFEYSDFCITAGFNNTASHGGPIHKGARVRVFYWGNEIARLEVAP